MADGQNVEDAEEPRLVYYMDDVPWHSAMDLPFSMDDLMAWKPPSASAGAAPRSSGT